MTVDPLTGKPPITDVKNPYFRALYHTYLEGGEPTVSTERTEENYEAKLIANRFLRTYMPIIDFNLDTVDSILRKLI